MAEDHQTSEIDVPFYLPVSYFNVRIHELSTCTCNLHLLPLVLKARHLTGSAFCWIDVGLPEQAVGWFPLGLGLVVQDRPTELSCTLVSQNRDGSHLRSHFRLRRPTSKISIL